MAPLNVNRPRTVLTPAQRLRIAANRRRAIARLAARGQTLAQVRAYHYATPRGRVNHPGAPGIPRYRRTALPTRRYNKRSYGLKKPYWK